MELDNKYYSQLRDGKGWLFLYYEREKNPVIINPCQKFDNNIIEKVYSDLVSEKEGTIITLIMDDFRIDTLNLKQIYLSKVNLKEPCVKESKLSTYQTVLEEFQYIIENPKPINRIWISADKKCTHNFPPAEGNDLQRIKKRFETLKKLIQSNISLESK